MLFRSIWAPDGRTNSPPSVLDTDARTAPLSAFNGLSADGEWTLFVADYGPKDTSTLVSWSIAVSGSLATQPPQLNQVSFANGQLGFTCTGTAGHTVLVQRSSNLVDWIAIQTNTIPITGIINLIDSNPPADQGFYRVLEP